MRSRLHTTLPLLLITSLLLAGCTQQPAPVELPSIQQAAVTPSLTRLTSSWLQAYTHEIDSSAIDLRPLAYPHARESVETGGMNLLISGSPPPEDWFATPLGVDAAAVIIHPVNPLRDLHLEELQSLLSGSITSWNDLEDSQEAVQVFLLLETDEFRSSVEESFDSGYNPSSNAILAPDPDAVLEAVQQTPGGLGIVPLSALDDAEQIVQVIQIDGILPTPSTMADRTYPFIVEIVACAPEEPSGALHDWLSWIQAAAGN